MKLLLRRIDLAPGLHGPLGLSPKSEAKIITETEYFVRLFVDDSIKNCIKKNVFRCRLDLES